MASKRVGLQLVDTDSGLITEEACPGCFKRDEKIAALKTEKRGWTSRYYNLRREVEGDIDHDLFPAGKRLFDFWKFTCRHRYHKPSKGPCPACKRTQFTAERFKQIEVRLREHGEELCHKAIEGAAYDPFTKPRRNGTLRRNNDWDQIFDRGPDKFMDFANRAPYHLPDPRKVKTLAKALAFIYKLEDHEAVAQAQERLKRG